MKKLISGFVLFLYTGVLQAANYYWTGGTGNWSNFASHWATSSGGTIFHAAPPGPSDDVFFDANSFLNPGDTVYVDVASAFCRNFDWTGSVNNPVFTSSLNFSMEVSGSFILENGVKIFHNGAADLIFNSANANNIIRTNNILMDWSYITFNNNSGGWALDDDLIAWDTASSSSAAIINVSSGKFYSNGFGIICNYFQVSSSQEVSLGVSKIFCNQMSIGPQAALFTPDSAFIQISPYSGTELLCHPPNIHFNKIEALFATVEIDLCFINFLECHYFIGFGNEIKELRCHYSINSQSLNNSGTSPNHFTKAFLEGSNISVSNYSFYIDTLFIDQVTNDLNFSQVDTIFILDELIVSKPTGQLVMHSSVNGIAANIFDTSGTVCIKNVALRDIHVSGGAQFFAGSGCTDLGNNTGWQFAPCSVISNVWPGDANSDLIVNNLDLLNIGLAFSETGPARAGASNNYIAQPATDWSSYFISAVNKKYADCDGNGVIDDDDTLAVSLNYGLTHPARLAQNEQALTSAIELSFQFPAGAIAPGSAVNIPVILGSSSVPADSIYGIAFTVNYDPSFINQGSMYADYSGSWIGNTGNSIHIEKDFSAIGKFEIAFTRTDHSSISGFGLIGMLNFIVANNAIGLMYLSFSNVKAITNTGAEIPLHTNSGSIATGMENIREDTEQFSFLYPNPFHDRAEIVFSNPEHKKIILKVSDMTGKKILYRQIIRENKIILEGNNLSKGMFSYELKSEDEKTLSRGKFVVN